MDFYSAVAALLTGTIRSRSYQKQKQKKSLNKYGEEATAPAG